MSKYYQQSFIHAKQARALTVMANDMTILGSRGSGKTTGVSAPWVLHKVEKMPGSCGALIAKSFKDAKSKILKPVFESFQMQGHVLDRDFVLGTKPPASWAKPLTPIIDWEHVISFPNGTTIQIISLHEKGSANSNSFQWLFAPEAKYMDPEQLRGEVYPTLRGLKDHFGDSPWYGAKLLETDKWGANIQWLLERRKKHDEKTANAVIYYQLKVNELRMRLGEVADSTAAKIRAEIRDIEKLLTRMRRHLIYFGEMNAYDNIMNLTPGYIQSQRDTLTEYEFQVAIENKDPERAENGFYPELKEKHIYHPVDTDEDFTKPLVMTMDWQASVTPIVLAQMNSKVEEGKRTLNFVNEFWVKHPGGITEALTKMAEHYKSRPCKEVIFLYDHTAVAKSPRGGSYYEDVVNKLTELGWYVVALYMGQAPLHEQKYRKINEYFKEQSSDVEPIRINGYTCEWMVTSIKRAGIKQGTLTEKDKGNEKNPKIDQLITTHFSDAFDQMVWGLLMMQLYTETASKGSYLSRI